MCSGYLPRPIPKQRRQATQWTTTIPAGDFSPDLKQSYADRRNTLTWALFIWSFVAVGFALFLPFEATLLRSVGVAVGWSAIHLIRKA